MRGHIQKWGNGMAVRIPRALAAEAGVGAGSAVELTVEKGRLILSPVGGEPVQLSALLRRVTKRNRHGEVDTGATVGREAIASL
jgi:antitoxin MazE